MFGLHLESEVKNCREKKVQVRWDIRNFKKKSLGHSHNQPNLKTTDRVYQSSEL